MGARIRTLSVAAAYARFDCRLVIFETFTPGPSWTSYRVTVGPRENPTTEASTLNSLKTSVIASIIRSLASERVFGRFPGMSMSALGMT